MVEAKDFRKEISSAFNAGQGTYSHALITNNCWQASPGKTLDLIRHLGTEAGGRILEQTRVIDVENRETPIP